ncbi:CYTH domain-containing protein [Oceanibacterium hippocampi]|nr:CYTH domain-containing protein [Oceanibacterium hippocampi]
MTANIEIERKFLVAGDGWRSLADSGTVISQGYLAEQGTLSIRIRRYGERGILTIKKGQDARRRMEFEYDVPLAEAEQMLQELCPSPPLSKTRYRVPHDGRTWEVDVFHGVNEGLVMAEIEFGEGEEIGALPDWAGREVTDDRRYLNGSLYKSPWSTWGPAEGSR